MSSHLNYLLSFIWLSNSQLVNPFQIWRTLFLDQQTDCDSVIRNDDMHGNDMYIIKSDSWEGKSLTERMPAECGVNFNFGDRLVVVRVTILWCNELYKEPFVAVYDSCTTLRSSTGDNLLALYNCNNLTSLPKTVHSSGSCISIYHYRGHRRQGYFFSIDVIAGEEVIAFPAGGIAAIIVCIIVFILFVAKIICCLSGYEQRIPAENPSEEKQHQDLLSNNYDNQVDYNNTAADSDETTLDISDYQKSPQHGNRVISDNKWDRSKYSYCNSPIIPANQYMLHEAQSTQHISRSPRLDRDIPPPPRSKRSASCSPTPRIHHRV